MGPSWPPTADCPWFRSAIARRPVSGLGLAWIATVHHGLDLARMYRLGAGDGGYLAFVGRISAEKDPPTAIRVAIRAGIRLKIAARVDSADLDYHRQNVEPLLSHPLIEWLGEINDEAKAELLGGGPALLMPINWEEPFGLSFIEALAAGTPIIARPRGSLPEIVVDGVHGFLVESEDEMVSAVRQIAGLDRAACRAWALECFSVERMTDDYERVYEVALEGKQTARAVEAGSSAARR